jgi:hypothetical protein
MGAITNQALNPELSRLLSEAEDATNLLEKLEIRGAKPPVELPGGHEWIGWLAAVALVAGAGWLLWRHRQKRRTDAETEAAIPPGVRAREQLREALTLLGRPEPFCVAVSGIVRLYLEEQFRLRAPERTTEEFLEELKSSALLALSQKESLGEFLSHCDLVKFARYEPNRAELRHLYDAALRLVEETEPGLLVPSLPGREAVAAGSTA